MSIDKQICFWVEDVWKANKPNVVILYDLDILVVVVEWNNYMLSFIVIVFSEIISVPPL